MGTACKNHLEKHGELFTELMKSPDGVFRGVHLGDSQDAVQQAETLTPVETSPDALTYETNLGNSGDCKIIYGFENGKLFEIQVESNFENPNEGLQMLQGFRDYFNEQYGPYEKERGNLVWKMKSPGPDMGGILEMTDETEFGDFGMWSLSIYRPGTISPGNDSLSIQ